MLDPPDARLGNLMAASLALQEGSESFFVGFQLQGTNIYYQSIIRVSFSMKTVFPFPLVKRACSKGVACMNHKWLLRARIRARFVILVCTRLAEQSRA